MVENRMVVDSEWSFMIMQEEVKEKLNSPGWTNIMNDTFVPDESAFDYAIEHCANFVTPGFHKIEWTDEFKEMVVEWFYSGNWIKED